ncbi:hypothetical protein J4732_19010 [Serratia marcescens]|uniref:Uncharacterized protein n=1 Tax=Serratia marcescens TaxID=615 RepID=A0A939SRF8_SERMA|nr:hypothetical protein [Serratia marcescens]
MPYLIEQGFSRGDLGFAVGHFHRLRLLQIHHGFGLRPFQPAVFPPAGLILAAAVMLFMGFVPWATSSIAIMFVLLFLCGWFPAWVGRRAAPWCTGGPQKERGGIVSIWNCANVGGGCRRCCSLLVWLVQRLARAYMPAFAPSAWP